MREELPRKDKRADESHRECRKGAFWGGRNYTGRKHPLYRWSWKGCKTGITGLLYFGQGKKTARLLTQFMLEKEDTTDAGGSKGSSPVRMGIAERGFLLSSRGHVKGKRKHPSQTILIRGVQKPSIAGDHRILGLLCSKIGDVN